MRHSTKKEKERWKEIFCALTRLPTVNETSIGANERIEGVRGSKEIQKVNKKVEGNQEMKGIMVTGGCVCCEMKGEEAFETVRLITFVLLFHEKAFF